MKVITDWLSKNNLKPRVVSPSGDMLRVSVPVGTANALLSANYTEFRDRVTDQRIVRTLSYSLPADVEEHLQFIYPTTQYVLLSFELSRRVGSFTDAASADSSGH